MNAWRYNFHSHTRYGDGHADAAAMVNAAAAAKMKVIGLSEHAPLGADMDWTMASGDVESYRADLAALRESHSGGMEVLCGLECDWWPRRSERWEEAQSREWDYFIGSVHFVSREGMDWSIDNTPAEFEAGVQNLFGGDIRRAAAAFFEEECEAALAGRFHILGHFDLLKKFNKGGRYFDMDADWYHQLAMTVVEAAAQSEIIIEVNTAGLDKPVSEFYPAPWLVAECARQGVRLTLNGDSHSPTEINRHFDTVLPQLVALGVPELWVKHSGQEWAPVPIR